jgi:nicotinamidase-related amidase
VGDPYTSPHAGSAALILIDVQRDFYEDDAPARIEGTSKAIPAMADLASAFRARGLPIVHVVRLYLPDGSNGPASTARAWRNAATSESPSGTSPRR